VVYGLNHLPYPKDSTQTEKFETGVIDSTGKWMIQYGIYKDIGSFKNGYTSAVRFNQTEKEREWTHDDAIIDKYGRLKFLLPADKFFLDFDNKGFSDALAVVLIYPEKKDSTESNNSNDDREFKGVVNTDGVILFSDTNWKTITPFTFNRAFVQDKDERWKMINTRGEQVCDSSFTNILYKTYQGNTDDIFTNGNAWVKLSGGWVKIDTAGNFLSQPKVFTDIHDSRLTRVGDIIFVEEDISVESPNYSYRYGFWNSKNNTSVSPTYHDIDMNGFNNDLIYAMKDGITYYINSKGEVIWQGTESKTTAIANLNIDYMNRGYFYAYSKPSKKDLGGFGGSHNFPQKILKSDNLPPKILSVVVHPELKDTIYGDKNAIAVYIGNTTGSKIDFSAQDSRLYMKVQALNSKDEWKDIEYLPSSWCGNSYHTLTLESKHFWTFLTPIYEGEFKTKLRIELKYIDPKDKSEKRWDKKEITVYSNEYEGSINPGQFWNKREYYPSGLMDPYND
jgi:WG containing repeat